MEDVEGVLFEDLDARVGAQDMLVQEMEECLGEEIYMKNAKNLSALK